MMESFVEYTKINKWIVLVHNSLFQESMTCQFLSDCLSFTCVEEHSNESLEIPLMEDALVV